MTLTKWTNNPLLNEMLNQKKASHNGCNFNRPAANIIDNEKDFTIQMAIAGMNKDDFNIKIEDDMLTISVERKEVEEKDELNYTRREFRFDGFSRSFTMPDIVDQEKIKADYNNGLMTITLPKSDEAKIKGREIKIS